MSLHWQLRQRYIPSRFPHHCEKLQDKIALSGLLTESLVKKADVPGAFLLLAGSILLVAALEEGCAVRMILRHKHIILSCLAVTYSPPCFLWSTYAMQ